ncbi:MAG: DUF4007 family protein [Dehalococcoidia bacterium]
MALGIKDGIEGAFGRHETFTIRYGWLKRAFDEAIVDPRLFYRPDAHHRLGVGKNMAKSMRFWLGATRLMGEVPDPDEGRRSVMRPTNFGLLLLAGSPTVEAEAYREALGEIHDRFTDTTGLDPYLEDVSSWWLLHWMMLSPNGKLPVWWCAFHTFTAVNFSVLALQEHVVAQVDATSAWSSPSAPGENTIKKDVLALLRAYAGTSGSRRADKADDAVDAPLVPLQLIDEGPDGFRFTVGPKPELPPAVAAFACLDFMSRTDFTARTALVPTLATEVGGPGRAFKLRERDLAELLGKAGASYPDLIGVSSTAGSDTLSIHGDAPLSDVATMLLQRHYLSSALHTSHVDFPSITASPELL